MSHDLAHQLQNNNRKNPATEDIGNKKNYLPCAEVLKHGSYVIEM